MSDEKGLVVECDGCGNVVNAYIIGSYDVLQKEPKERRRDSLLKCPHCKSPLLTRQNYNYALAEWEKPTKLYPQDDNRINPLLPKAVKLSFQEAITCYKVSAYTATAIMCRKTLEGICKVHSIGKGSLMNSLKEMKNKGVIADQLYDWADALRISGNEAAHDVNVCISKEDAKDILEFTEALIDYVFTFRDRFIEFQQRMGKRAGKK